MILVDDNGSARTKLQEENRKKFREYHQGHVTKVMEAMGKAYGLKDPKKALAISDDNFSIKEFRKAAYATAMRLREAQSETAFGQLLRAGILNEFNNIYQAVEVTYDAVVRQTQSNKRQEFYAPLERVGFPKLTQAGEPFVATNFKGVDKEIINKKYGMILDIERELVDDDQTGQIIQRAQQMGENARIHEEAYVWQRLSGVAGTFDGEAIPASVTYPTPYAVGVVGTSGGIHGNGNGVNATASHRISQSQVQAGWILSKKMLDQSGRPMVVTPKTIAVSPQDIFFAQVLFNSVQSPSKVSSQSAEDGQVGGIMGVNPIQNLVAVIATRFLPDYGCLLIDPAKGFAFQRRDPTEVIQENPQSGPAFSQEVFRYKERSRWEADFIDPKFIINLNLTLATS